MKPRSICGVRTAIQHQCRQGTAEETSQGRHIHLGPPASDFPEFDRRRKRTPVIGYVDQKIRGPSRFEVPYRSLDVELKLRKVPFERADEHLAPKRRNMVSW